MYVPGEVVVRSGRDGAQHTETWYAGPDGEVILRKSPSGNSLRAVCHCCFSSPTLLYGPPHNNLSHTVDGKEQSSSITLKSTLQCVQHVNLPNEMCFKVAIIDKIPYIPYI